MWHKHQVCLSKSEILVTVCISPPSLPPSLPLSLCVGVCVYVGVGVSYIHTLLWEFYLLSHNKAKHNSIRMSSEEY